MQPEEEKTSQTSQTREKTERNAEIIKEYSRGRTIATLSEQYGISKSTIKDIIARHRAKQGPIDKAEHINQATDLIDHLVEEAMKLVSLEGAPVTAGKDGLVVIDPELKGPHGEPVFVRDYSARLAAINAVKGLMERKAKLLGLDSAQKAEIQAQVNHLINGVSVDSLK